MQLELRDLESSTVYTVDAGGAVLGRERARTDISFRDESISKQHARIFSEDGAWFIEDLGSSNGTFVKEQRIQSPAVLSPGMTFTLAQRRFEVLHADPAAGATPRPGPAPSIGSPSSGSPSSINAVLLAVPKAVVYLPAAALALVVRPAGAVQRALDAQGPAASAAELAAYGFVAGALSSLIGAALSLLSAALAGALSAGPLLAALPSAAIAAVVGGIVGFFLHPILSAVVGWLRGTSTPQSRTACAKNLYAFSVLAPVPAGVGALAAGLPLGIGGLVPVLGGLLVALLGLYLAHQWASAFSTAPAVGQAVLGLGAFLVLVSAAASVRIILHDGPSSAPLAAVRPPPDPARTTVSTSAGASLPVDGTSPEAPGPSEDAPTEARVPPDGQSPRPDLGAAAPPASDPALNPAAVDRSAEDRSSAPAEASPEPGSPYGRFRAQLGAIERALDDEPALLERKDVLDDYRLIARRSAEIEERWQKLSRRKPKWEQERILARKHQLELFRELRPVVERLHRTIETDQSSASRR